MTYNVWPVVGMNVKFEPMLTAAISCTAHPQSIEATLAMLPMEFASAEVVSVLPESQQVTIHAHAQIHARRFFQFAGAYL